MKTLLSISFIYLLFINLNQEVYSQTSEFDCQYYSESGSNIQIGTPYGGRVKPNRTDISGGQSAPSEAYFPVLIVFVQFKDEDSDPRGSWPKNLAPVYLNKMIAKTKNASGDWWNWYDPETQIISSHWSEISRGKFHVISPVPDTVSNGAFSVVLPKTAQEYFEFYSYNKYKSDSAIHCDIWASVKSQGLFDWRPFDRWKKVNELFYFTPLGEGDGYVDMIYKVTKFRGADVHYANNTWTKIFQDNDGYNKIGTNYFDTTRVDTFGTKIDYGSSEIGSGVTISFRGQLAQYIGTMGHEHGHQSFMPGHVTYSRASFGIGIDNFYSPYDMILNDYMQPRNCTFNSTNGLYDYSSRNSGSGEILKVPVQGNEYFLLVSRNKVSKWDRNMVGDIAQIDPYGDISDFGKGLYIYHIENGIYLPCYNCNISPQDMECADGYWDWEYGGQSEQQVVHDCYLSPTNGWAFYKKKTVLYKNDRSLLSNSTANGDGVSFRKNGLPKWWSFGKKPDDDCSIGIDRISTNLNEVYTSFEFKGDRWDAWKPGYNEVFSPYSSPNTNTWADSNSGIFIWHYSNSGSGPAGLAYMKIYKAEPGVFPEDSILHLTPPSRPMGIVVDYYLEGENYMRPIITWNHNKEPDMLNDSLKKRYKIWRATQTGMYYVPTDYTLIKTLDIDSGTAPSYIDTSIVALGSSWPGMGEQMQYPVRYTVQAIDKYADSSVRSDFGSVIGLLNCENGCYSEPVEDNILSNEQSPKEYSLNQNYPNPFNPTTNIQYDLPKDNFVSIKIYNILGKEVLSLVNEFKQAGSYLINFNGSNLSSGIYYYKIKAGNFEKVRKMVLIK